MATRRSGGGRWLAPAAAVLGLMLVAAGPARAQGGGGFPGVAAPGATPCGWTYGQWGHAWWTWALSIPTPINPLADTTGAYAAVGQKGRVWFLGGTMGNSGIDEPVVRRISVPAGTAFFFPIYNYVWINTPQFGDPPWTPKQAASVRAEIARSVEAVQELSCTIDGREVPNLRRYRGTTPNGAATMITLPPDNLFGVPGARYGPMVTDGYYLWLAPLAPGRHTIRMFADSGEHTIDVTYEIVIWPARR